MAADILTLPAPWRRRLVGWSRAAAPREACGLLLGRPAVAGAAAVAVERALWSPNLARRADRFELDPSAHLLGELVAREQGLEVVGVWHSHPGAGAEPSPLDRAGALPGWWYVIVGCVPETALRGWWSSAQGLRPGELA